jgi:hypothetical protein
MARKDIFTLKMTPVLRMVLTIICYGYKASSHLIGFFVRRLVSLVTVKWEVSSSVIATDGNSCKKDNMSPMELQFAYFSLPVNLAIMSGLLTSLQLQNYLQSTFTLQL